MSRRLSGGDGGDCLYRGAGPILGLVLLTLGLQDLS
jgi:hypothetical protein